MTLVELPIPESPDRALLERLRDPHSEPQPEPHREPEAEAPPRGLAIICYSGDLEKTWAALILASTAGAMAMPTKVFVTFWGLQTFVRDERRITGETWMQKMLALMQRPGVSH